MSDKLWVAATATAYILGVGTGILLVFQGLEQKYRKREEESVKSVKEAFLKREEAIIAQHEKEMEQAVQHREALLQEDNESKPETANTVTYIPPDDFDEIEDDTDYEVVTVVYHDYDHTFSWRNGNGLLGDDDWKAMLGANVVQEFGKYDDDRVIARNDEEKIYYEVLFDEGEYIP